MVTGFYKKAIRHILYITVLYGLWKIIPRLAGIWEDTFTPIEVVGDGWRQKVLP